MLALRAQLGVSPQKLQEFLRLVSIFAPLVQLGRLHMRLIQFWLSAYWDHSLAKIYLLLLEDPEL